MRHSSGLRELTEMLRKHRPSLSRSKTFEMSSPRVNSTIPDFLNQNNTSEAGPEVALFSDHNDSLNFNHSSQDSPLTANYDTRTITKQSLSKLQINSRFGTFTRKTCESIEKYHSEITNDGTADVAIADGTTEKASDESGIEDSPSHDLSRIAHCEKTFSGQKQVSSVNLKPSAFVSPMMALNSNGSHEGAVSEINSQIEGGTAFEKVAHTDQGKDIREEAEQLKRQLNDAYAERDQAIAALRAYEELLKKINETKVKPKSYPTPVANGTSTQKESTDHSSHESERLAKRNTILERTVDNLEQTVQDTMSRMNEIKDVNQELKNVLTDQQDMLAQYKSTIEQKSFEYRDLQIKHDARIEALVTENKRDRALLEKQITLLRAEAHMKSLDNERLESECRIKGEQLARLTEMLNELRQSY